MAFDILGGLFGAAGSVAGAAISAEATAEATRTQIKALEKQRKFVFDQLDPAKVGAAAEAADVERAKSQLALQAIVDPELLKQRYASQAAISQQLQNITGGSAPSDQIAALAVQEAQAGGIQQAKTALIDAALKELSLGATLPPDVQAELVQTGLARSGRATGGAGGAGFGGQLLTTILGGAGVALQKQRQDQAIGLLGQAQNLEQSRAAILGTLFPNLRAGEQAKLGAAQSVFANSAAAVPEAGLGGSDVANLWLARVGATNQLAQRAADAAARGGYAQAQILQSGIGQATQYVAPVLPTSTTAYNWLKNITGGSGRSGDTGED